MVARDKRCEVFNDRVKRIWSLKSNVPGFQTLFVAKWKLTIRLIAGKHINHADTLFLDCAHADLEPQKRITIGMFHKPLCQQYW